MRRVWLGLATLGVAGIAVLALPAPHASAHPLGNFSVNQALAIDLYPNRVEIAAVVDLAELPTLQERAVVAAEGAAGYNARVCAALAHDVTVRVDGRPLAWTVRPTGFAYRPGSAGLHTTRLTCALSAPADLAATSTLGRDQQLPRRSDRLARADRDRAWGAPGRPLDPGPLAKRRTALVPD